MISTVFAGTLYMTRVVLSRDPQSRVEGPLTLAKVRCTIFIQVLQAFDCRNTSDTTESTVP